jgi:hypothetical protein
VRRSAQMPEAPGGRGAACNSMRPRAPIASGCSQRLVGREQASESCPLKGRGWLAEQRQPGHVDRGDEIVVQGGVHGWPPQLWDNRPTS